MREQASLTYLYVPTSFGGFPGGLNSSFTPFSVSDLKIATLPLDSKTAMSLQLGSGAKLTQVAGDSSSTAYADIGGGTTICFIGVNSNLAGNENKNCKIILLEYGIHLKHVTTGMRVSSCGSFCQFSLTTRRQRGLVVRALDL